MFIVVRNPNWSHNASLQEAKEEPHLTPDQLRGCASRALAASLQLVSKCSDMGVEELERWYRMESSGGFFDKAEAAEIEDVLLEDVLIADLLKKAPWTFDEIMMNSETLSEIMIAY